MSSQNTNQNPSPFRAGADKLNTARLLYMAGDTTQKGIAKQVGVSERTIHSWIKQEGWDRLRQAARTAPAIIAENMFSQLVELQNDIASREVGKRYPTMQEAELTRKLCNSIDKMKSAPALSQSMQVLRLFRAFAQTHGDRDFRLQLNLVIEHFLEGNAKNGFMPYQIEYDHIPPEENNPPATDSMNDDEMQESFSPATSAGQSENMESCSPTREPVRGGGRQTEEKRSLFFSQSGDHSASPSLSGRDGEGLLSDHSAHETSINSPLSTSDPKKQPAKTGSKTEANPLQNTVNTGIQPSSRTTGNSSNFSDMPTLPNHAKAS